jgi:PAS domain S-box-containing protein
MTEHTEHILVVEDEEAHVELIRRAFEGHTRRFRLSVAGTLEAARTALVDARPDLIIADWLLPDGRGMELLPAVNGRHAVPVVVMTSHGNEQVAVEAMKAGALDYVVKSAMTFADMPHVAERALREWRHMVERRRAETALRESEARYRALYEDNPSMYFTLDADGAVLAVNRFGAEQLGYTPEELVGQSVLTVFHADDREAVRSQFALCRRNLGQIARWEFRKIRKDGSMLWVKEDARAVRDADGRLIVLVVCADITERKQAEAALRESEERYRQLVQTAQDVIFTLSPDGRLTSLNLAFEKLSGWPRAEWLGQPFTSLLHPEDVPVATEFLERVVQGETPPIFELRLRTPSGDFVVGEFTVTPQMRERAVVGVLGIARDITERKRSAEALRQAQKLESLGVLAGGVAHDFNNLLVAMLGQTSLALAQLPPESPARASVEKAVLAAQRAADLTRQLLAYSGRGQFEIRPLSLNALIRENLHLLAVALPKHVRLKPELAEPLPLIKADAGQMQQVIMNLILNAAEAIGARPGTVAVVTGAQALTAGDERLWQYTGDALPPGDYATLEVRDDGCGMNAETLARIFDPFFTTKLTGRGLGLAAVLGIVRGHGGGLRVESAVGQGTTFTLFFPVTEARPAAPPEPEDLDRAALPPGLVLVIDDEEPVRQAAADILALEGLPVVTAPDGDAGLRLYRERADEVRLVVLDLSMPGRSGEETWRELRRINPDVRVILSSGYSQFEAAHRFVDQGLAGFLQKPYDMEQFIEAIRKHMR